MNREDQARIAMAPPEEADELDVQPYRFAGAFIGALLLVLAFATWTVL